MADSVSRGIPGIAPGFQGSIRIDVVVHHAVAVEYPAGLKAFPAYQHRQPIPVVFPHRIERDVIEPRPQWRCFARFDGLAFEVPGTVHPHVDGVAVHELKEVLAAVFEIADFDPEFFAALADYRAAFQHDSATTEEFTALISSSFGQDLTWFTDQWVMNPGSPDYEWNYDETRKQPTVSTQR